MVYYSYDESNLDLLLELLIDIFLEQGGTDDEHSISTMQ
jgi:hypothetical protein